MVWQKVSCNVTLAKAGVQNILKKPDSGFRRNDWFYRIPTSSKLIKIRNVNIRNRTPLF